MMENPAAVLAEMDTEQLIAMVSFAVVTVAFFVWVALLWLKKH